MRRRGGAAAGAPARGADARSSEHGREQSAWFRSCVFTSAAMGVLIRTLAAPRGGVAVPFPPQPAGIDGRGPRELTRRYDVRS